MNNISTHSANESYFAAANGYTGFRSLFSEIFNPKEMSRMFILKGGPGTGKSTLMKNLLIHGEKMGYYTEAVYCSSDPDSLDGVILSSQGKKISVIDGTAPHECDAVFPGAADELVNLADGFDTERLTENRNEIISISSHKKSCYGDAYMLLRSAGSIHENICAYYSKYADYNRAELMSDQICERISSNKNSPPKRIYTSAFGKKGYTVIRRKAHGDLEETTIRGDGVGEYIFMSILAKKLLRMGAVRELHLSPFSGDIYERIVTDTHTFEVTHSGLTTLSFSNQDALLDPLFQKLFELHASLLDLAREKLSEAANHHFALEAIYSKAVNFRNNDKILNRLITSVDSILGV